MKTSGCDASTGGFREKYGHVGAVMPNLYASACSSQEPLFSQIGQKWLPSTKSSSMIRLRCSFSSSVLVSTTIHSAAGIVHALATFPLTFTEQTRQCPAGCRSAW
jgi:hypothetical protein